MHMIHPMKSMCCNQKVLNARIEVHKFCVPGATLYAPLLCVPTYQKGKF